MRETKSLPKIKTKFIGHKHMWSAFVTYDGYDYQEYGETEFNAIHFLVTEHPQLQKLLPKKVI